MSNLAEALQAEITRVRDEVLPQYIALRGMPRINVEPAIFIMRAELDAATKALAEGDAIACMRCYESLKETKA